MRDVYTWAHAPIVAGAVLVPVLLLAGGLDGIVVLVIVDVVLAATLVAEHARVEG